MNPATLAILEGTHAASMKRYRQLSVMVAAYGGEAVTDLAGDDRIMAQRIVSAVCDAGFAGVADRLAADMAREGGA